MRAGSGLHAAGYSSLVMSLSALLPGRLPRATAHLSRGPRTRQEACMEPAKKNCGSIGMGGLTEMGIRSSAFANINTPEEQTDHGLYSFIHSFIHSFIYSILAVTRTWTILKLIHLGTPGWFNA